jgi:hypothetical protein
MLSYFSFAVPFSSSANRQEEVERRGTVGTINVALRRISVESHGLRFFALARTDPLRAS